MLLNYITFTIIVYALKEIILNLIHFFNSFRILFIVNSLKYSNFTKIYILNKLYQFLNYLLNKTNNK
jgi:hypothetical protein